MDIPMARSTADALAHAIKTEIKSVILDKDDAC